MPAVPIWLLTESDDGVGGGAQNTTFIRIFTIDLERKIFANSLIP